jgi:CRISPR-associated protein Csb2
MAHSRHYVPIGSLDGYGREKTALIFDTWVDIGDNTIEIQWDCVLEKDELALLTTLVHCLGYLGRSESWVEARLLEDDSFEPNTFPFRDGLPHDRDWEQVLTIAPLPPDQYSLWAQQKINQAIAALPLPAGRKKPSAKLAKERAKAIDPYPPDLLDCLLKDTAWWKSRRWSQPPGSQALLYYRQPGLLEISPPSPAHTNGTSPATSILLSMTSSVGRRTSLPSISRTLSQAELLHKQLVSMVPRNQRKHCSVLTGCDSLGRPLTGPHEHAHIIPLDLDNDGHLDHFLIHAVMGLTDLAQRAVRSVKRTFASGGSEELQLAIAGCGTARDILNGTRHQGLINGGLIWKSVTPFVLPRFRKKNGKNSLEGQIQAELLSRGLPPAIKIEILHHDTLRLRPYIRVRKFGINPPQPPSDMGFAIQLQFDQPIPQEKLPLTLGYASHFGLGLFEAIDLY